MKPLTNAQARALAIIDEHAETITRPRDFAGYMWPDSDRWTVHTRCGYGVTQGGGMSLAAGGYLGKLVRAGLVQWYGKPGSFERRFYLTDLGIRSLAEWRSKQAGDAGSQ